MDRIVIGVGKTAPDPAPCLSITPPGESQAWYDRIESEKRLVTLSHCRHYEAYAGGPFEQGIAEITAWFSKYPGAQ